MYLIRDATTGPGPSLVSCQLQFPSHRTRVYQSVLPRLTFSLYSIHLAVSVRVIMIQCWHLSKTLSTILILGQTRYKLEPKYLVTEHTYSLTSTNTSQKLGYNRLLRTYHTREEQRILDRLWRFAHTLYHSHGERNTKPVVVTNNIQMFQAMWLPTFPHNKFILHAIDSDL